MTSGVPVSDESFLHMRHVSVSLGDRLVLHDLSLSIRVGEHIAILGPNGCGKSTLIRTLNCELYPLVRPGTELRIFERPRWDLTQLRRHFGIVSDNLPGYQGYSRTADTAGCLTARTTGLDATLAGFFAASTLWPHLEITDSMREAAHEALARIDATHFAHRFVGEMSAGEKRRILIARALVHRPRQLLFDEPSNALDIAAQRDLREVLRRLANDGTGIILVTHHLADILPEIDRVLLMRDGHILADGPRTQLLTAPMLSELFRTEVRVGQDGEWLHTW